MTFVIRTFIVAPFLPWALAAFIKRYRFPTFLRSTDFWSTKVKTSGSFPPNILQISTDLLNVTWNGNGTPQTVSPVDFRYGVDSQMKPGTGNGHLNSEMRLRIYLFGSICISLSHVLFSFTKQLVRT